ncbi:hypothetical protein G210_2812 [Candida maltosa Xu316]|uniref:Uncharacterized protein n=1 Tax=Candida maltosa (strain Xu316) TaxID=1245528 RepID=M3JVH9_CANMX|nr:hypothetical protein G210_2812 [Candida maltosa Xu316]
MSHDKVAIYTQPENQQAEKDVAESAKEKLEHLIEKHPVIEEEDQEIVHKIDHDGLEIPEGKIPLDSQFSTLEAKKIIEIAQQQGLLKETVEMKITDSNDHGDKLIISDK